MNRDDLGPLPHWFDQDPDAAPTWDPSQAVRAKVRLAWEETEGLGEGWQ